MPRKEKAAAEPILQACASARGSLRRRLREWFARHERDLPWRRTRDPYAILVSELMLQQTQVATVIPYFERWLARFPDFRTLAEASEAEVLHAWQGLGYYARARNLHAAARHVVRHHGGALPDNDEAIAALPGVGRYTRGAVASFAFDRPVAAVDANIARVLSRLFAIAEPIDSSTGAERIWAAAELLLPTRGGRLHTSALMELGALICSPRDPRCLLCPARKVCAAAREGDPERYPVKKARRARVEIAENCGWIQQDGAVLLEQQVGSRWRGLWKLPLMPDEVNGHAGAPLWEAAYPFTHHRVLLRVFRQEAPAVLSPAQRWFAFGELADAALPSPHRRAVSALARTDASLGRSLR